MPYLIPIPPDRSRSLKLVYTGYHASSSASNCSPPNLTTSSHITGGLTTLHRYITFLHVGDLKLYSKNK